MTTREDWEDDFEFVGRDASIGEAESLNDDVCVQPPSTTATVALPNVPLRLVSSVPLVTVAGGGEGTGQGTGQGTEQGTEQETRGQRTGGEATEQETRQETGGQGTGQETGGQKTGGGGGAQEGTGVGLAEQENEHKGAPLVVTTAVQKVRPPLLSAPPQPRRLRAITAIDGDCPTQCGKCPICRRYMTCAPAKCILL